MTIELRLTFLGTGTSQGVPVIGCTCGICTSEDPRDKRLRTAALLSFAGRHVAIDCGPDFRQQMLRAQVRELDAILITHEHNDHIAGLDDVRPFNFQHWTDMPVYASQRVQDDLRERYGYVFAENKYPGAPMIKFHTIDRHHTFKVSGLRFNPVHILHGEMPILGFRMGGIAYLTDVLEIPRSEWPKLRDLDVLVLSALHHHEHHSHLNLKQALYLVEQLRPNRAFFTHMSHRMGHHEVINRSLPDNVNLAFDGLSVVSHAKWDN